MRYLNKRMCMCVGGCMKPKHSAETHTYKMYESHCYLLYQYYFLRLKKNQKPEHFNKIKLLK